MGFTDEQLCQLIDGEMTHAEELTLRSAMAADDKLAERFAELAMIDARYKSSVSSIDEVRVPEPLLSLLTEDQNLNQERGSTPPIRGRQSFWKSLGGVIAKPVNSLPSAAMAFAFLLLCAVVVVLLSPTEQYKQLAKIDPKQAVRYGLLDSDHPVSEILSNAPSGSPQPIPNHQGFIVTPMVSFSSKTGSFCREYTLSQPSASHQAVACYQDEGWRVVLSTSSGDAASADEYQTAFNMSNLDFNKRVNEIIAGDPLSYQQELVLIKQGWTVKKPN